jgi:hypothetical protein
MTANLISQYDEIVVMLTEYHQFERRIRQRLLNPLKSSFIMSRIAPGINKFRQMDAVAAKHPALFVEILRFLATPAELDDPKFRIIESDYPIDLLSRKIEEAFTDFDFGKLAKFHKTRSDKRAKASLSIRNLIGVVFGAGSLVLQFTPQPVVESLNIDYNAFQIWVFWITLVSAAYIGTIVATSWISENRARQRIEFISDVLDYTALRLVPNAD